MNHNNSRTPSQHELPSCSIEDLELQKLNPECNNNKSDKPNSSPKTSKTNSRILKYTCYSIVFLSGL